MTIIDAGIETASVLVDSCFISGLESSVALAIISNYEPVMDVSITNCFFSNAFDAGASIETIGTQGSSATIKDVTFRNCIFSNGTGSGLVIDAAGGLISTVAIEDCVSQGNRLAGYATTGGILQDVVFKDCIAQNNATDGFSAANCSNIIYEHCFSQSNAGDGFTFNTTTTVIKVRDCISETNGGVGYNNRAAVGANIFLANSSFGDTTAFVGVDYALTKTGATAVSNATYWNNVVF
jgi:polygalacturonase